MTAPIGSIPVNHSPIPPAGNGPSLVDRLHAHALFSVLQFLPLNERSLAGRAHRALNQNAREATVVEMKSKTFLSLDEARKYGQFLQLPPEAPHFAVVWNQMASVTELDLTDPRCFTPEFISMLEQVPLEKRDQIISLKFCATDKYSQEINEEKNKAVLSLLKLFRKVTRLASPDISHMSDDTLIQLSTIYPNLTHLSLSRAGCITGPGVLALGKNCKFLNDAEFTQFYSVPPNIFRQFIMYLPKLQRLNIWRLTSLPAGRGIWDSFSRNSMTDLTLPNTPVSVILAWIQNCPSLTRLTIPDNRAQPPLTFKELSSLLSSLPNLTELQAAGCKLTGLQGLKIEPLQRGPKH